MSRMIAIMGIVADTIINAPAQLLVKDSQPICCVTSQDLIRMKMQACAALADLRQSDVFSATFVPSRHIQSQFIAGKML